MAYYDLRHEGEDIDALLDKVDAGELVEQNDLSKVATSGDYNDLGNKPNIPDIVASQIFLELHTDFDDFQVFSHKRGYEEHNRKVCQRLIENCFSDKTPNNEVFFVTINGLRDGVPYMETAILESQAEEIVRASFVKGNIGRESSIAASIGILSIDVEGLRAYAEYGEDTFYWRYFSTQVPSIDAIGSEGESDVYVTEFTFEQITTKGTAVNVSPELVSAIYNKRIIVIPSSKTGNYIATNTLSNPPFTPVNLRMQIATGVYIYEISLSAKGAAPQTVQTVVSGTNLLYGRLNTINGASLTGGVDMQLVSSISLNGKTYTPTKGAVDLGSIEGGGETNTMVSTSWSRLVSARDSGELIPGTYYRIIDYVTTTTQEETTSAGNLFDVIVFALDEQTLSEEAYAIQSKRDTDGYFANSNLAAWKLWYCLDNDTSRFAWSDEENGRGVIYRMIDEFGNDCPYDFKNILFTRYELEAPDEYEATSNDTEWMVQLATNVRAKFDVKAPSFVWAGLQLGEYYWEYEFGEVFSQATSERKMFYTFSDITDFENKEITSDASLMASTYNNKIGYSKDGIVMLLPNNVFFGADCYDNSFGNNCVNNSIGNWACYNTFSHNCYRNTFGADCLGNKLYHECNYIILNDSCYHNTFGIGSYCNSFGDNCTSNVFGEYSYCNSFGFWGSNNILGRDCGYNIFHNECICNSFGNSCQINSFSADCSYNNFGNACCENRFRVGAHYRYNTFGEGVRNLHLVNYEQGYYDNAVQNYSIANGVQGTEEPLEIDAERNRNYETTIARNSSGEIVQFCEGDNVGGKNIQLLEDPTIDVLEPNKIYVYATNTLSSITINSFSTTDALTEEYVVQFRTFPAVSNISLPSGVMWANGVIPTLDGDTLYELSIVKTHIGETDYFKAVLTPFK